MPVARVKGDRHHLRLGHEFTRSSARAHGKLHSRLCDELADPFRHPERSSSHDAAPQKVQSAVPAEHSLRRASLRPVAMAPVWAGAPRAGPRDTSVEEAADK